MSGHVRERLSAYLDRELSAPEDQAVEAHLRDCAVCRGHLEALAAVDRAARALPVEAPPGYFDALPARVRQRLEAPVLGSATRARPRPPRLPVWAWAVAAVLVLAVVTPLTVRQKPASLEDAAFAPAAPPPVTVEAVGGSAPLAELLEPPAAARPAKDKALAGAALPAPVDALRESDAGGRRDAEGAFAPPPAPPATPAPPDRMLADEPVARRAEPYPGMAERKPRAPGPGGPYAQNQAPLQRQVQPKTEAPAEQQEAVVSEASRADSAGAAAPVAETRAKEQAAAGFAKSAAQTDRRAEAPGEREFRKLLASPETTLDALRRRRDAWRAFAARYPTSVWADEARVRGIETGAAAFRAGRDTRDLARAQEDAAAYLERNDAAQAARVHAIVGELTQRE